jgi:tetratricopeptide (TPR) repeat protein
VDSHPAPPPWPPAEAWQPPLNWPPPPPAPPGPPDAYPHRRWPLVLLVIGGLVMSTIGVVGGAAVSTAGAVATASHLAATGDYANAIALDEEVATRTGPLYLLDPGAAAGATYAAQATLMAWAAALGRGGKTDEAVAVYRAVTASALRKAATNALAALLYQVSVALAARAEFAPAILRLEEIIRIAPATPGGVLAKQQLPIDQAAEAGLLVASGHGTDAVSILNTVVSENSAQATRTANSLYPTALLAAAEQDLAQQSYSDAVTSLQHLVTSFPTTSEAAQAKAMLAAPQTVSGTLVNKVGAPVTAQVRLSTHYKAGSGATYQTSGPFYDATSDASGEFAMVGVPIGGPYVLEVFSGGNWTTQIDPNTDQPSHPVSVTALTPVELTIVVLPS